MVWIAHSVIGSQPLGTPALFLGLLFASTVFSGSPLFVQGLVVATKLVNPWILHFVPIFDSAIQQNLLVLFHLAPPGCLETRAPTLKVLDRNQEEA
jgi:hypothetical protein